MGEQRDAALERAWDVMDKVQPRGDDWQCRYCLTVHPTKIAAFVCDCGAGTSASADKPLTGGSSDYYHLHIARPLQGDPYDAQCLDVICALRMTFEEGEAFKAIWRKASARLGNGKPGHSPLYDAEKVQFYGAQMVRMEAE